jgi:hypothetical protein
MQLAAFFGDPIHDLHLPLLVLGTDWKWLLLNSRLRQFILKGPGQQHQSVIPTFASAMI